tara:strand:- start:10323 stop:10829 length:507 start_codon:yes stop_codon:yes gene_type:complete
MTKGHLKIVNEIVEKYKKDKSTIAITLFGSLARGNERPDSDVDIEIISKDAKKWELLKKKKYSIEIDLVICPEKHLLHQIQKYPYLCYDYLNEKIVYDPKNFMKELKKKLKRYFKKHPEIVKFWKNKLKIMKENKAKGQDPKDAIRSYDEAERLFSDEHKVTRNFFRE